MTVETLFKRVLGLTYVLHSAQPARNEINNISSVASDTANGLVEGTRSLAEFPNVVLTNYTTGITLKSTMLDSRGCLQRGNFSSDNQVP